MARSKQSYPRTLCRDVCKRIDPRLKKLYVDRGGIDVFEDSFDALTMTYMNSHLDGETSYIEIKKDHSNLQTQLSRKKKRWFVSSESSATQFDLENERNPFHYLLAAKQNMTATEWRKAYGDRTPQDVLQLKIQETREWSESKESYFLEFPSFTSLTPRKVRDALKDDIVAAFMKVLEEDFHYSIEEYLRDYIDEMGNPFFTASKKRYSIGSDGDMKQVRKTVVMDEDGLNTMLLSIGAEAFSPTTKMKSMSMPDARDQELLSHILKLAGQKKSLEEPTLTVPLSTLAKMMFPHVDHLSAHHLNNTTQHLIKIANFTANFYTDSRFVAAYNFISSIEIKKTPEGQYVDITLGNTLHNALLAKKIKRFRGSEYDRLSNTTARILFIRMQQERIKAYGRGKKKQVPDCVVHMSYSDFLSAISFPNTTRKENITAIKKALNDFVEQGTVIQSYTYDRVGSEFKIEFFPLTEDEVKDYLNGNDEDDN